MVREEIWTEHNHHNEATSIAGVRPRSSAGITDATERAESTATPPRDARDYQCCDEADAVEYWVPVGHALVPATPEQVALFKEQDAALYAEGARLAREHAEAIAKRRFARRLRRTFDSIGTRLRRNGAPSM